jgi:hypothetical protein
MPIVLKFGSLSLLETYGPIKACNGIDLAFSLFIFKFRPSQLLYTTKIEKLILCKTDQPRGLVVRVSEY